MPGDRSGLLVLASCAATMRVRTYRLPRSSTIASCHPNRHCLQRTCSTPRPGSISPTTQRCCTSFGYRTETIPPTAQRCHGLDCHPPALGYAAGSSLKFIEPRLRLKVGKKKKKRNFDGVRTKTDINLEEGTFKRTTRYSDASYAQKQETIRAVTRSVEAVASVVLPDPVEKLSSAVVRAIGSSSNRSSQAPRQMER
jgi:hypothetical protein